MPKNKLTDLKLKSLKPGQKPAMLSDGGGLYLKVYPNGKLQWLLRKTSNGKAYQVYLGHYPEVSIKQAREAAANEAARFADGRAGQTVTRTMTVRELFEDMLAARSLRPSSIQAYRSHFNHLKPLENRTFDSITPIEVKRLAEAVRHAVSNKTALSVTVLLAQVELHACALGLVDIPRMQMLSKIIPRPEPVQHRRHVPAAMLCEIMERAARGARGDFDKLIFLLLTLGRVKEVTSCRWSWVDMASGVITFPAEIMKAKRPHRVPVCRQLHIHMQRIRIPGSTYVLDCHGKTHQVNCHAFSHIFKKMGILQYLTPHGVRAMARTWFADQGFDFAAAEMCLAHRVENATQMSYQHSDYLEKRREIMQAWADYVEECARPYIPDLFAPC